MTRKSFAKQKEKSKKKFFDLVHRDLCEMKTLTHQKKKYVL